VAIVTGATGGIGRWIALGLARAGHHTDPDRARRARTKAAQAWIAHRVPQASTEPMRSRIFRSSPPRAQWAGKSRRVTRKSPCWSTMRASSMRSASSLRKAKSACSPPTLLSPFVLTRALLPALLAGAPSRIVTVGSSTSDSARIDPDGLVLGARWTMVQAYGQSKLAAMMMTFAFAKQLAGTGVTANVVHPGLVASGLVRTPGIIGFAWRCMAPFALSEEQGADTPLAAALAPEFANISGVYLKTRRVAPPNRQALDPVLVDRVWAATQRLADVA
jgi:NAD(P)-dependent dehydrogenase (short-subunit alcohol dehydrogenase family)